MKCRYISNCSLNDSIDCYDTEFELRLLTSVHHNSETNKICLMKRCCQIVPCQLPIPQPPPFPPPLPVISYVPTFINNPPVRVESDVAFYILVGSCVVLVLSFMFCGLAEYYKRKHQSNENV